jgi:hypothetical protein
MMITDSVIHNWLHPPKAVEYAVMVFFTIGVIALGKWILYRRKQVALEPATTMAQPVPVASDHR